MGPIHSLHKYLSPLAERSVPLLLLLSRKNDFIRTNECQLVFENLKLQVANIVELHKFGVHRDIRIVCDASHNGLGAVLEPLGPEGGDPFCLLQGS